MLAAGDGGAHIVTNYERGLTTTVNDIEHIESQTLAGISVVKIFFQPSANIAAAVAQVTAISQTQVRSLPPGTTPPLVILQRFVGPQSPGWRFPVKASPSSS